MDKEVAKDIAKDVGNRVIKVGMGLIPIAGPVLSEGYDLIVTRNLDKRSAEVINNIQSRINRLEMKFSKEELSENQELVDVILEVHSAAIRTSQEYKKAALYNALSNTPGSTLSEDKKMMFLRIIKNLTPSHLKLLKFFVDPNKAYKEKFGKEISLYMGGLATVIEEVFENEFDDKELLKLIIVDLNQNQLINGDYSLLNSTTTNNGLKSKRTTNLGDEFIEFISEHD